MVKKGEVECVRASRGSGGTWQKAKSQAPKRPQGNAQAPTYCPGWVSLPIPPKSGGQDILLGTPLYTYVEEAECGATRQGPNGAAGSNGWGCGPTPCLQRGLLVLHV